MQIFGSIIGRQHLCNNLVILGCLLLQCGMGNRFVHLLFLDGVGLGSNDPQTNPFALADLPFLTELLGEKWYATRERISVDRATLVPTDANLGVKGRPQSATGQATIVTGRNVSQIVGRHFGPWPTKQIRAEIMRGTIFSALREAGFSAELLNPYPQAYFDAIASGRRSYSAIPFAAKSAGQMLFREEDLRVGRAMSPGFTNEGWRDRLGAANIEILTHFQAGQRLAQIAQRHTFSFLEHWMTDILGHRGPIDEAARHLEKLDAVIGGLLSAWDDRHGLLMITSDHGNIEEKQHTRHTRNAIPTILVGTGHRELANNVRDLADLVPTILAAL